MPSKSHVCTATRLLCALLASAGASQLPNPVVAGGVGGSDPLASCAIAGGAHAVPARAHDVGVQMMYPSNQSSLSTMGCATYSFVSSGRLTQPRSLPTDAIEGMLAIVTSSSDESVQVMLPGPPPKRPLARPLPARSSSQMSCRPTGTQLS